MTSDESTGETMETNADSDTGDSREQGVDIGPLADKLEDHSFPAMTSELVDKYGDYEIRLADGTQSFGKILDGLEGDDEEYGSVDEVRQMIYNMVGADAIGREGYSDRGGVTSEAGDAAGGGDESL